MQQVHSNCNIQLQLPANLFAFLAQLQHCIAITIIYNILVNVRAAMCAHTFEICV